VKKYLVDLVGDQVGHDGAGDARTLALTPDALELLIGVALHDADDLLHVVLVELRLVLEVRDGHVLGKLLVREGESSQHLFRRRGHTTLVGRGILSA
jgi:hypothetical protein